MATQQAWDDYRKLLDQWAGVATMIAAVKTEIDKLSSVKAEVITDANRKSAWTSLGNQHPVYNTQQLCSDVDRLIALKAILIANGY
jgi:hypothetical protein